MHHSHYTGKFLRNFRALRAQANFESDFEKSLAEPMYYRLVQTDKAETDAGTGTTYRYD